MFDYEDGHEVWLTKPECPRLLPLKYFMGKMYEDFDTDESTYLPLFTSRFDYEFPYLFDSDDIAVMNFELINKYSSLFVKPKYYQKRGAYDEDVEVPVQYTIKCVGTQTVSIEDNTLDVSFNYMWDDVEKVGHSVTNLIGMPPLVVRINVNGDEVSSTINEQSLDVHTVLEIHLDWVGGNWVIFGEIIKPTTVHHTTKTVIIHHDAEKFISRQATLANMETSCIHIGFKHYDEWVHFKALANTYNSADVDELLQTVNVLRETINATDVESGSIKSENTQTPNGWKQVETPSGTSKTTTTNSRTPNTNDNTFYNQTKSEVEDTYNQYKRETEQQGTMDDDTTTTFQNHTHTQNGKFTEQGFRGKDVGSILYKSFKREGLEWIDKVLDDIVFDLLIMSDVI